MFLQKGSGEAAAFHQNAADFHFSQSAHQVPEISMTMFPAACQDPASGAFISCQTIFVGHTSGNDQRTARGTSDQAAVQRHGEIRITHNPHGISGFRKTAVQHKIVLEHSPDPRQDSGIFMPQPVDIGPGFFAGDPF